MSVYGTAWFSDFKMEAGIADTTNTWNFLCLLFDYVDANVQNKNIKLGLSQSDKEDITTCMRLFQSSIEQMSIGKIKVRYNVVEIKTPITSFSYDEENGYFVSGYDIKDVLDPYLKQGKYDYIYAVFRTGDMNQKGAIPVNDWIGLGFMEYRNIGFSNIRLPDDENDYVYKYDTRINTFPEEVLMHEFLHTLERNADEYGEERPALHDNEKYGYIVKPLVGLQDWYQDYMNKSISTSSGYIGLPADIYTKKPVKSTDFDYTHDLKAFEEPENIIDELNTIWNRVKNLFSILKTNKQMQEK